MAMGAQGRAESTMVWGRYAIYTLASKGKQMFYCHLLHKSNAATQYKQKHCHRPAKAELFPTIFIRASHTYRTVGCHPLQIATSSNQNKRP